MQKLSTFLMAGASFFGSHPSVRGDGAVLESSQELRQVEYFRSHPEVADRVIDETTTVDSAHLGAKARYRAVLEAIDSDVRFLGAQRLPESTPASLRFNLDLHDYFAGVLEVSARDADSGRTVPVSRPALFRRGDESYARVVIGPLDSTSTAAVDVEVRSLETEQNGRSPRGGRIVYGKRVIIGGEGVPASATNERSSPVIIHLKGVDHIPPRHPEGGAPWDFDGTSADLRLVLFEGEEERYRTEVFDNVSDSLRLDKTFVVDEDPSEVRLSLEVWDVDVPAPEIMGRVVWNPGQLHSGAVTANTDTGIALDLDIVAPETESVRWDPDPFYLNQ